MKRIRSDCEFLLIGMIRVHLWPILIFPRQAKADRTLEWHTQDGDTGASQNPFRRRTKQDLLGRR
jgi:hypothetical protein